MFNNFIKNNRKDQKKIGIALQTRADDVMGAIGKVLEEKKVTVFELLDVIMSLSVSTFPQIAQVENLRRKEISDLKTKLAQYVDKQPEENIGEETKK